MTDFEKAEFWEGLGRLYNETLALREATQALARVAEVHSDRLDRVEIIIENGMQSHEKRMQRIEARHEETSKDLEMLKQRQEAEHERIRELRQRQEAEHEHLRELRERMQDLRQIAESHERRLGGMQ